MHIYTFCPSWQQSFRKFCWAVSEELCWPSVLSIIFHFGQKGKKKWIQISCRSAYLHGMSFKTTKFNEILLSGFWGYALTNYFSSIFHFGQISKRALLREKKMNQNFLWICKSTHYVLHNYKVSRNSVERFQMSCADKKNRTDGLTDWLTKTL